MMQAISRQGMHRCVNHTTRSIHDHSAVLHSFLCLLLVLACSVRSKVKWSATLRTVPWYLSTYCEVVLCITCKDGKV